MAHMPLGSANTHDEARMRSVDSLPHSDGMGGMADGMAARTPYGQDIMANQFNNQLNNKFNTRFKMKFNIKTISLSMDILHVNQRDRLVLEHIPC